MEYYSAIKRNEVLMNVTKWINIEKNLTKCKKLVTKAHVLYDSIYMNSTGKSLETESRLIFARHKRKGECRVITNGY